MRAAGRAGARLQAGRHRPRRRAARSAGAWPRRPRAARRSPPGWRPRRSRRCASARPSRPHLAARARGRAHRPGAAADRERARDARERRDDARRRGRRRAARAARPTTSACATSPRRSACRVLIAARPGLGTINHTLLTLAGARAPPASRCARCVLTPWPREPSAIELSNRETIARSASVEVDGARPRRRAPIRPSSARAGERAAVAALAVSVAGPRRARLASVDEPARAAATIAAATLRQVLARRSRTAASRRSGRGTAAARRRCSSAAAVAAATSTSRSSSTTPIAPSTRTSATPRQLARRLQARAQPPLDPHATLLAPAAVAEQLERRERDRARERVGHERRAVHQPAALAARRPPRRPPRVQSVAASVM